MADEKNDLLVGTEDTPPTFEEQLKARGIPEGAASMFVDETPSNDTPEVKTDATEKSEIPEVKPDVPANNDTPDDNPDDEDKVDLFGLFNQEYKTDFTPDENKDTLTQLKDYVNHIIENTKKSEQEATLNDLKTNPLVKHILDGYSEEVVNHEQNLQVISAIDIAEATVEIKSDLYKQSLLSKGIDEEEADDMVATAIANDTLDTKAEKAKTSLETYFKSQVDNQKALEDKAKLDAEENYKTWSTEVTETVKKGFNGIVLPDKDINELIDYTTKVNPKTGLTKADETFYALPNEDKITIDYIIKNNLLKTVATALKTPEKVNRLKELTDLNNKRPAVKNPSGSAKEVEMDLKELKRLMGK